MSNYIRWNQYGVIYEIIMRKFRASMEPFWDLKFNEILCMYIEYLACAIIQQCVSFSDKLVWVPGGCSGTQTTDEQRRPNPVDIIIALRYIYSTHHGMSGVPQDQSSCTALSQWVLLSFEVFHYRGPRTLSVPDDRRTEAPALLQLLYCSVKWTHYVDDL